MNDDDITTLLRLAATLPVDGLDVAHYANGGARVTVGAGDKTVELFVFDDDMLDYLVLLLRFGPKLADEVRWRRQRAVEVEG